MQEKITDLGNLQLRDEALPTADNRERTALVDGSLYKLLVQQIELVVSETFNSFTVGDLPLKTVQKLEELLSITGSQFFKDFPELTSEISEGIVEDIDNWEQNFSSGYAREIPLDDIMRLHTLLRIKKLLENK